MNDFLKHARETLCLPSTSALDIFDVLAFCREHLIDSIIAWHGMVWHGMASQPTYLRQMEILFLLALDIHSNLAILSRMDGWMHWFFLLFILRFLSM